MSLVVTILFWGICLHHIPSHYAHFLMADHDSYVVEPESTVEAPSINSFKNRLTGVNTGLKSI